MFPGYEKVVQDRNQMTVDDVVKEQDELQNEEDEDTAIVMFLILIEQLRITSNFQIFRSLDQKTLSYLWKLTV